MAWTLASGMKGLSTCCGGGVRVAQRPRLRAGTIGSSHLDFSPSVLNSLATADSTGTHSLYTTYQDHEIMFHVSTMLPYTPNNQQQVRGAWDEGGEGQGLLGNHGGVLWGWQYLSLCLSSADPQQLSLLVPLSQNKHPRPSPGAGGGVTGA